MELKLKSRERFGSVDIPFNQTKMELKQEPSVTTSFLNLLLIRPKWN